MSDGKMVDTERYVKATRVSAPLNYNRRDLILYAIGIGSKDPRFVYERHPDFAAFPTYPICFTFKGDSFDVLSFPSPVMRKFPGPPLPGVTVGLDAEKIIEKVAELPLESSKLRLEGGLVSVQQKPSGALCEHLYEVKDEAGKVYYRIMSSAFSKGATNYKPFGPPQSVTVTTPDKPPTAVVEVPTDPNIANIFRLSGDYNPLHVDTEAAKDGGFDQPILHGLCTLGHCTRALLDTVAGGDQRRFKSVQLRFSSPVIPGQTLSIELWIASPTEVVFRTLVKETGKVCINNALLRLNPEAKL